MIDIVAVLSLVVLFGLAVLYTRGCDHLKGSRR